MPTWLDFSRRHSNLDWAALMIGSLMAVYWFRVLRMVRKSRRKAGHSANFVPPEPLGRALRLLWIPIVALWILLPLAAFFFYPSSIGFIPLFQIPVLSWLAVLIALAAFAATLLCWKKMGASWRMGIDPTDKTQLVCSGPYAYVRHPIYALSSLLMLMTVLILPTLLMLGVGVMHLLLLQWEAGREERYLLALHGEEYRVYRSRTGRFLPRSWSAYSPRD